MTMCDIQAGRSKWSRGYIDSYRPSTMTRALMDLAQAARDEYRSFWPQTCSQTFYRMVGAQGYDKTDAAYERLCQHLANTRRGKVTPFNATRPRFAESWQDAVEHTLAHAAELSERDRELVESMAGILRRCWQPTKKQATLLRALLRGHVANGRRRRDG